MQRTFDFSSFPHSSLTEPIRVQSSLVAEFFQVDYIDETTSFQHAELITTRKGFWYSYPLAVGFTSQSATREELHIIHTEDFLSSTFLLKHF